MQSPVVTGLSPLPRGERWRSRIGGLLLLLLLACALPAAARPQVLVVLADHLTLADVTRPGLPNFARMRAEGQTALMSPGLAQGREPVANVYATLGAGDSIRVGDVSQGQLAQALAQAHVRTALIGNADGDDTGEYRPASLLLPAPDESFLGEDDGTVADPIAPGGRRINPGHLWALTQMALRGCGLVIVHDGDFARAERENARGDLLPSAYRGHSCRALEALDRYLGLALPSVQAGTLRLLLVVPTAPPRPDGRWDSLTPLLCAGILAPDIRSALLTSDTTQTPGLVAARDLAPTLLRLLAVPAPLQMTGAPVEFVLTSLHGQSADLALARLDRLTRLNQQAQNPLFWSLGFAAAVIIFAGLFLYLSGRMAASPGTRRAALCGLRLLSAWPLALLLAPRADPKTLGAYFAGIALLTAVIALLPSPSLIHGLTAIVLLADGLTGTQLVSQSVLSVYALAGIRFYGIGNEYMGVLIAGALLAAQPQRRPPGLLPALWFALVTFVLSYPAFGAKAGGAVTATATFVIAWRGLRGLPVGAKHVAGGVLGGFALVFLWAFVGHWFPARHTHIESAVYAVGQGRLGYIAGVALRKVGLAVHVFLLPGTLMGVLGLVLIGAFARLFLRRQVGAYLGRHPRFAAVWHAGLWGCVIAVLFNDSGIIAAILLLTCLIVTLLHGLYQECALWPSTSETSASASPSATP